MRRKFEIRRVHFEGKDHISCGVVLPHEYIDQMRIGEGDFVKIYQNSSNNKIVIEKLVQEPQNDTNAIGEIVNNTFG
jgi:bifunctional DNA-binding transcriptional regulator/antitoxin component of YhaV-PrlF toxin-antitoxin module